MGVLLGIFVFAALTVAMGATLVTNRATWEFWRQQRREWRAMPPEKRREITVRGLSIAVPILMWMAVVVIAPRGLRHTLTYLVILPLVVVGPVGTIIVGVRAARRPRR
jgi:hypothetical protein